MIRLILYLVIFIIGLALAALWFGEMRHLRQAIDDLPFWTIVIADDARVPQGEAAAPTPLGKVTLNWDLEGLRTDGVHWDLTMSGVSVEARADLAVPFWPQHGIFSNGKGTVSVGGQLIRVTEIEGRLPLLDRSDGYIELTVEDPATLPDALVQIAKIEGNRVRIPLQLP